MAPVRSISGNNLINYGEDMSGLIQLAEVLKTNSTLISLEYAAAFPSPKVSAAADTFAPPSFAASS